MEGPPSGYPSPHSNLVQNTRSKKTQVIHHDLLKKCETRVIPLWIRKACNKLLGRNDEDEKNAKNREMTLSAEVVLPTGEMDCWAPSSMDTISVEDIDHQNTAKSGRVVRCPTRFADVYE